MFMFVLFNVRIMFGNIKKKFKQRLNVRVTWAKLTKHNTHTHTHNVPLKQIIHTLLCCSLGYTLLLIEEIIALNLVFRRDFHSIYIKEK